MKYFSNRKSVRDFGARCDKAVPVIEVLEQ